MNRVLTLLASTLLLSACTTHLQQKEQFLQEAGFHAVSPSTPAQIAHLKSLPQGHITQVTHKGKTLFMLADSKQNLLLVGDNARFEKYQQILYTKKVDPAKADAKTIRMEESAWGAWGGMYGPYPYGPYGPMFY
jgi:hypothetical protein